MSGSNETFDVEDVCLGTFPKNTQTETWVGLKGYATRKGGDIQRFLEIREMWFKDGPSNEPIRTRKGVMIHRKFVGKLILMVLKGLANGEIPFAVCDEISVELERVRGEES